MWNIPKLSFCITCKNRFPQIKETLPRNLKDNELFKGMIEFVLVDFDSKDGLFEWIMDTFKTELGEGYLKYFFTSELPFWHASIAKNTSHLYASNDILVNLDCDNYTGKSGGRFIINNFVNSETDIVLHQFNGDYLGGTFGRISVLKKYFLQLCGYDESFEPMGYQDLDLINRLKFIGLEYKCLPNLNYSKAIRNTKELSLINCNTSMTYWEMQNLNVQKSQSNIKEGKYIVNETTFGIRKNVFNYKGKETHVP